MASSTKTVEEKVHEVSEGQPSRAAGVSRRALLGLAAFGAAARAEAQVRDPKRSRPTTVQSGEMRLLRRVTVGVTSEDVAWMNSLGYYAYLEWQLNHEAMGDPECEARLQPLITINLAPFSLYGQDSAVVIRELTEATIIRAIYSNRQLFERMVEFWADHFNTNITSVGIFKTLEVRDVYRRHALGTFAGMLNASASSPAMLTYLNNTDSNGSRIPNSNPPAWRVPNQNYARELLELHTLGVDGGYTQQDVMEIARCFSGWRRYGNTGDPRAGTFFYDPNRHDDRSKLVLGVPIAPGGGFNDGLNVLNIVATHPSTARFVSKKLLRWLLNYEPSPALVADIAGEFTRTGGDIKSIVRRILHYDNVIWSPPLFKRPFHFIVSALRVMNANITSLNTVRQTYLAGTGHTPYAWGPPDGYPHEFEYWGGLPLPRWNFAFQLANNSVSGAAVDTTALLAGANTPTLIADRIDALLFAGEMPAADKAALITYLRPSGSATMPSSTQIRDAFGLAMASPGFQWH
jgi:uncharacterized protein (DUF1800 family)